MPNAYRKAHYIMRTAGHKVLLPWEPPCRPAVFPGRPLIQCVLHTAASTTSIQMQDAMDCVGAKVRTSKAGGGWASAQQVQRRLEKQWHLEDPL